MRSRQDDGPPRCPSRPTGTGRVARASEGDVQREIGASWGRFVARKAVGEDSENAPGQRARRVKRPRRWAAPTAATPPGGAHSPPRARPPSACAAPRPSPSPAPFHEPRAGELTPPCARNGLTDAGGSQVNWGESQGQGSKGGPAARSTAVWVQSGVDQGGGPPRSRRLARARAALAAAARARRCRAVLRPGAPQWPLLLARRRPLLALLSGRACRRT
jgi:hypothetical protein